MGDTKIEWADAVWNPIRGCTKVSDGCRHCYAMRLAARFSGPGQPYEGLAVMKPDGPQWTNQVRLVPERLADPLRWKKPRRIFVNSMGDLFHEKLIDDVIDQVFAVMASASQHQFLILTKRPKRMRHYFNDLRARGLQALADYEARKREYFETHKREFRVGYTIPDPPTPELRALYDTAAAAEHQPLSGTNSPAFCGFSGGEYHWRSWPLPNVWLGVSVEDQETAIARIPALLETPAAVRFVSAEPLLGPIDLQKAAYAACRDSRGNWDLKAYLHWVIVGGESGPGARPMHPDWTRSLRDQCQTAGIPFFFKQWGEWLPQDHFHCSLAYGAAVTFLSKMRFVRLGKQGAGRSLDGLEWDAYPEVTS